MSPAKKRETEKRKKMNELQKAWERSSTLGNPDSQSEQAQKKASTPETQKREKKESTEQRKEKETKPVGERREREKERQGGHI